MYFTSPRLNRELAGGTFVDIIIDGDHDPTSSHPFKSNVDLDKLTPSSAASGPKTSPT